MNAFLYSQTFVKEKPKYQFDKEKNILVEVGVIDIQQEIDSYKDTTLESILDKYLSPEFEKHLEVDYLANDVNEIIENQNFDIFELSNMYNEIISELRDNNSDLSLEEYKNTLEKKINEKLKNKEKELNEKEN